MSRHSHWEEIWQFNTARFRIVAEVTDCEDDPADSFSMQKDIDMVREGRVKWFDARVRVLLITGDHESDVEELGSDYLGRCAYDRAIDLFRHHASGVARLRRLRGRTDSNSRRERKRIEEWLANNLKLNPPHTYGEYGPDMVREAVRDARRTLAKQAEIAKTLRQAA